MYEGEKTDPDEMKVDWGRIGEKGWKWDEIECIEKG
jgi:hypothetical protein